ncbi:MAG: TolC family protein [Alphaproteobacteria bacterium]
MIKIIKSFWVSFLIVVLSISCLDTASARPKKSKKIAKVLKKNKTRHKKRRRNPSSTMAPVVAEAPLDVSTPSDSMPLQEDVPQADSNLGSNTDMTSTGETPPAESIPAANGESPASDTVPSETVSEPLADPTEAVDPTTLTESSTIQETQTDSAEDPSETNSPSDDLQSSSSEAIETAPAPTPDEPQESTSESSPSAPPEPQPESNVLNDEIVTPVSEKTPEEALSAESGPTSDEKIEEIKTEQNFLTLKDALEGAYNQSPLLTAEYQVKEAQMALAGAKRQWLPKTSASLGYSRTSGDYVSSGNLSNARTRVDSQGNTQSGTTQGSLTLQQNLYSGGATTANILAQEKNLDATLAAYMGTLRDTLYSAIKSFIELSARQELFRLNKANQALLEKQLEVAQNRYEFGELTRYDVAATQAKLDKAKADVITALSEVEIAKATFVKVTGITVEKALEKPSEPTHLLPASKADAIQLALKLSPELQKQEAIADAAKARTDQSFSELLPSFDISASASRKLTDNWGSSYYNNHGRGRQEAVEAGATLSIPLDFRGATQSGIRQQKYAAAQKRLAAIYERRNVMELVSRYWDSLEAARAKITQIKSQVNAAKIAVETVTEEFLAGNKTTLDVLTAEQELFSAQVDLVNAEQAVILNSYQLLATIGQLNTETLNLQVAAYNPTADYENLSFWGTNINPDERIEAQELSTSLMKEAEASK